MFFIKKRLGERFQIWNPDRELRSSSISVGSEELRRFVEVLFLSKKELERVETQLKSVFLREHARDRGFEFQKGAIH